MKIVFLSTIMFISILSSNNIKCTKKQFLLNLLDSNAIWHAIEKNVSKKPYPMNIIRIQEGMVSIKTNKSDYHSVVLNIIMDDVGVVGVFMQGGLPFGVKFSEEYKNKDFIFSMHENDCTLEKIKLEIKTIGTYNKKKELIIFKKYKAKK